MLPALLRAAALHASPVHQRCPATTRCACPADGCAAPLPPPPIAEEERCQQEDAAKMVRWRVMALMCHSAGDLTAEDAAQMLELMVRHWAWCVHHC